MEIHSNSKPRPTMLKDFLRHDISSCSSSDFRSFPRQSCYSSVRNLLELESTKYSKKSLKRSTSNPSKPTISAFQKVLNVVKHLSPSKQGSLPRSLSRKLKRSFTSKTSVDKEKKEIRVVVKVKDIMKWKSFRDLAQLKDTNSSSSPDHTTITTTTTTATNSWSDSDFTSECLRSSSDCSEFSAENECKKYLPHKNQLTKNNKMVQDSIDKSEARDEEKDQFSPVSVLDFPFEDDEDSSSSSFQSKLDNMERTKQKLMQKIKKFECLVKIEPVDLEKRILAFELNDSLESHSDSCSFSANNDVEYEQEEDEEYIKADEKATELLMILKKSSLSESWKGTTERLVLDFLRDELIERNLSKISLKQRDEKELLHVVTEWLNGDNALLDWGIEESREVYYKEMQKGGRWGKFEQEQGDIALDVEIGIFNSVMDELLFDLVC